MNWPPQGGRRRPCPRSRVVVAMILLAALAACGRETETPAPAPAPPARFKRVFHLNPYEKDFGYAQAVLIDKTLYVSSSVSVDEQGLLGAR